MSIDRAVHFPLPSPFRFRPAFRWTRQVTLLITSFVAGSVWAELPSPPSYSRAGGLPGNRHCPGGSRERISINNDQASEFR
jgi:hypothetical protein